MRRLIELELADVLPSDSAVVTRLGFPPDRSPSSAVAALIGSARSMAAAAAKPRAVVQPITPARFLAVYSGEGMNSPHTPLEEIIPRAEALSLFVATIGSEVELRVRQLFVEGEAAAAAILDAVASEIVTAAAALVAGQFAESVRPDARALPYSPGYCGWHVSGQRSLFAEINPSEIGVSLNARCLMTPVKSVSGVIVAGEAKVHQFRPRWTFCDDCIGHECRPRMASVR